ncbi:MAG: SIMPL domain-containing protein [Candidatus Beckwithbacteria bacterium]|nr:SIMPL domain-containing protein [Candidatus Beckwithbacteria bacterium]
MTKFILAVAFLLIGLGASWLTPWSQPRAMITVTGQAKQQVANQIANFNVSVTQADKDKQAAVEAVNQEMDKIIKAVKGLGVADKDIKTQNISVHEIEVAETEIMIYPPRPRSGEKQWQASNSLAIILREVDQTQALADLLQGFSLAQVSGPGFSLDESSDNDAELLTQAVEDARKKAEQVAAASGRKLGKALTVSEGFSSQPGPLYRAMEADMALTPTPVEPGSSQTSKTVTVVFELK